MCVHGRYFCDISRNWASLTCDTQFCALELSEFNQKHLAISEQRDPLFLGPLDGRFMIHLHFAPGQERVRKREGEKNMPNPIRILNPRI